jgi:hypothetical protein
MAGGTPPAEGGGRDMAKTVADLDLLVKLARGFSNFKRCLTLRECKKLRRWKLHAMTCVSEGETVGWFFRLPKHAVVVKPENKIIRFGGVPEKPILSFQSASRTVLSEGYLRDAGIKPLPPGDAPWKCAVEWGLKGNIKNVYRHIKIFYGR